MKATNATFEISKMVPVSPNKNVLLNLVLTIDYKNKSFNAQVTTKDTDSLKMYPQLPNYVNQMNQEAWRIAMSELYPKENIYCIDLFPQKENTDPEEDMS